MPGTTIAYTVDGAGRRVAKRRNGAVVAKWLYDGPRPIAELAANNGIVSRFVYGTRPTVPEYMLRGGATYRLVTDHLGSPRLVIDVSTGTVAQRLDYDEFGRVTLDTNPGFQPFGFAGGLYDPDTGLVRFGARDYDPGTRRWTAKDPILFNGADTNFYSYAVSDPVDRRDPSGLDPLRSPKWQPPTNPPQLPPVDIPDGWRIREMPPTPDYPDGYWKLEKPMNDGSWQPIDPSTMKPGRHCETHTPFPEQPNVPEPTVPDPRLVPWWLRLAPLFDPLLIVPNGHLLETYGAPPQA